MSTQNLGNLGCVGCVEPEAERTVGGFPPSKMEQDAPSVIIAKLRKAARRQAASFRGYNLKKFSWRGAGVVERARLESECTG